MRAFVVKFGGFVLLQAVVLTGVYRLDAGESRNSYMAVIRDKMHRLARLPSPKLVLVGGSNMAFGMDTPQLERSLGLPAVNMGLHAGLGVGLPLRLIRPHLKQGDVVVLSFEYECLTGSTARQGSQALHLIEHHRPALWYVPPSKGKAVLDEAHLIAGGWARTALRRITGDPRTHWRGAYCRQAFNPEGDAVHHRRYGSAWRRTQPGPDEEGILITPVPIITPRQRGLRAAGRELQDFVRYAEQRGAVVLYSFPPQPAENLELSRDYMDTYYDAVAACDGLIILDRPDTVAYEWADFFDTVYHLTRSGAVKRTGHLSAGIDKALGPEQEGAPRRR